MEMSFLEGAIKQELGKYLQECSVHAVAMGTRRWGEHIHCLVDSILQKQEQWIAFHVALEHVLFDYFELRSCNGDTSGTHTDRFII